MARRIRNDGSKEALLNSDADSPRGSLEGAKDLVNVSTAYVLRPTYKRRNGLFGYLKPTRTCLIITGILFIGLLGVLSGGGYYVYNTEPKYGLSPPWYPAPKGGTVKSWEESYKKAAALVGKMTLLEKVNITTGTGWSQDLCVGSTGPAIHAGFPALCLQDGPLGIRFTDHNSVFPAGITVGATWNRDLMYRRGKAHALEARGKGVNVLLGPAMGPIGRMPAGGRTWEGFGADPVLQAVAASETIKGIQSEGIIATAKHLVGNEQEHFRQPWEWGIPHAISANIDDRTLHELYGWPFAESVRAGVASVMCSYNQVNNSYACGNSKLLNGFLKDELGFQGFIQSDWLAQRGGVSTALAGLDMTMPGDGLRWQNGDSLWGGQLTVAILNGSVPIERLNDAATRIVAAWYQLGQDDKSKFPDGGPNFSSWTNKKVDKIYWGSDDNTTAVVNKFIDVQGEGKEAHGIVAREVAAEGTVVVKNKDNILPLNRTGPSGSKKASGNGRFRVAVFGEDAGPGKGPNFCLDRACNQGTLGSGWGSGAAEFPYLITPIKALEEAFDSDKVELTQHLTNTPDIKSKPSIVEDQDLCLVFINADAGEGFATHDGIHGDRNDLYSQKGGDDLVKKVAINCGKGEGDVVVIIHSVGPVLVEKWVDLPTVKGIVFANLPGQESGNALADVLFGDVDASGRLPYTLGKSLDDYGEAGKILYYPNGVVPQQDFKEGLYIDYRHFDKSGVTPRYEFGFGLSYTTWSYSSLKLTTVKEKSPLPPPRPASLSPPKYPTTLPDPSAALFPANFRKLYKRVYPFITSIDLIKKGRYPYPDGYDTPQTPSQAGGAEGGNPALYETHVTASITLKNTGPRKGKEVVQVYVSFPDDVVEEGTNEKIDFPVKVLRAFSKVEVEIGENISVELNLTRKDLSYWSVRKQNWVMPSGKFTIRVGRSSRDLPLEADW